jgi:hypothetical protein
MEQDAGSLLGVRLSAVAHVLVDENWPAIARVAAALLDRGELVGNQDDQGHRPHRGLAGPHRYELDRRRQSTLGVGAFVAFGEGVRCR